MKTIVISGVIGWDVSPADIRKQISEADGSEPLDVQISSPGGFVTDGLEIFNILRNYTGPKNTHLMGEAASMASYLAMVGDKVTAEANSVFMIHNALGVVFGNHNDLRGAASVFEGFSTLLAKAYAKKSGKTVADIKTLMDGQKGLDGTYFFGSEAKDAGFVDEIIGEPTEEKAAAISIVLAARASCDEIVRKASDPGYLDRIAAMIPASAAQTQALIPQASTAGVASSAAASPEPAPKASSGSAAISEEEVQNMDPDKLKAEHPDVFAAVKASGYAEGQAAERERIVAIDALGLTGDAAKIAEDAKADGKSTAGDVALKVVQAQKGKTAQALVGRQADADALPAAPAASGSAANDEVQAEINKIEAARKKTEGGK